MFFFGIFGIQDREKHLRDFDATICPSCGRLSRAELILDFVSSKPKKLGNTGIDKKWA